MRIGLISDTHIPWDRNELPPQVFTAFRGVDLILHAGDMYDYSVLDDLEKIAPVLAALGDDDHPRPDPRVQDIHVLKIEGHTVWLLHEGPYTPREPHWLSIWWQGRVPPDENPYGKPDIVICGHEHCTSVERCDGFYFVNPGSPTVPDHRPGLGTVAILELNEGSAEVRMIQLGSDESEGYRLVTGG